MSSLFLPTERRPPADAEALSHKLMVRAGLVRQLGAGLWSWLPAGWRVHQNAVRVVREEIDKSLDRGAVDVDARKAAEGAEWLQRIEDENADELTPERIAQMEAAAAKADGADAEALPTLAPVKDGNQAARARPRLDEDASPTAGRRFTRA